MSSGKKPPRPAQEKLATSREIYHRVRWDPRIDRSAYTIGYEDRSQGEQEIAFGEFVPDGDIPWHRVWWFRCGGEVMWDRRTRVDKLSSAELDDAAAAGGAWDEPAAPLPVPMVEPEPGEVSELISYRYEAGSGGWVPDFAAESDPDSDSDSEPEPEPEPDSVPDPDPDPVPAPDPVPVPAPDPVPVPVPAPPKRLTVVTFNVLCDLHDPEKVQSERRLPALLSLLRKTAADVIALQEITPAFLRALLAERWVRRGYRVSDSPRGDTVLPTGELLLSRWPLTRLSRYRFSLRKTALVAELALPGRALRLGVVHLTSNRGTRPEAMRAAQLWTLLDAITAAPGADAAAADGSAAAAALSGAPDSLLVGDFNAGERELDELTSAYDFRDAWRAVHPHEPGYTYDPETNSLAKITSLSGQRSRYDRVLTRSPAGALRAEACELLGREPIAPGLHASDHYALRCTLALDAAPRLELLDAPGAALSPAEEADLAAAALTHHSALVLIPPESLWPPIQAIRARHDKSYRRFMPHLTLLYGFVPEERFGAAATALAPVARRHAAFQLKLGALATFVHRGSQTVWSQPTDEPHGALAALQAALEAALPQCNEQSTRSAAGFTPHLTLAQLPTPRDDEERQSQAAQLAAWRRAWHPLSFQASELAMISRRGDEPFEVRARIALGSGAVAWTLRSPLASTASSRSPSIASSSSSSSSSSRQAQPAAPPWPPQHTRALALLRSAYPQVLTAAGVGPASSPSSTSSSSSSSSSSLLGAALVQVLGSARLGTLGPDSDLDAFCVGPASLARDDFFALMTDELRETGALRHARIVPAALVPVLELSLGNVAVDLAYVGVPDEAFSKVVIEVFRSSINETLTQAFTEALPDATDDAIPDEIRELLPGAGVQKNAAPSSLVDTRMAARIADWIATADGTLAAEASADAAATLDAPSRLTLLGALDSDLLLACARRTCGEPRYRQLVSLLTRWARGRAIHGNAYGYLGGFSWAVLAAWAAETFPGDVAAASLAQLAAHLFTTLAAWEFHRPIALAGTAAAYQPARHREPLLLLAPALPVRNTARNALRATVSVLRQEFVLGRDAIAGLASGDRTAAALERALLAPRPSPAGFTEAVELSLRCRPAERLACRGWVESQILTLFRDLERELRIRPIPLSIPLPNSLPATASPTMTPTADAPTTVPLVRIPFAALSHAPPSTPPHRTALVAAERLAAQFAAWPERPADAALLVALVDL